MRWMLWAAPIVAIAATVAFAAQSVVRCPTLAAGGGPASSPTHTVWSVVGLPGGGTANSANHEIRSGPWDCPLPELTAAEPGPSSPATMRLHPNVPNPFNPSTELRFELPRDAARVSLAIFDAAGRRIRTLVDGPLPAGAHRIRWNGQNDDGITVASGSYFYLLDDGARRLSRRMTLLK